MHPLAAPGGGGGQRNRGRGLWGRAGLRRAAVFWKVAVLQMPGLFFSSHAGWAFRTSWRTKMWCRWVAAARKLVQTALAACLLRTCVLCSVPSLLPLPLL